LRLYSLGRSVSNPINLVNRKTNSHFSCHHRAFHLQQPFLRGQSLPTAVAVEFAVHADHAMTGDHHRDGVHGVGAADRAIGMRTIDLFGDLGVGPRFAVRDAEYRLQGFALKRGEESPVHGDGEGMAFALDVLREFLCVRFDPFRIGLDWSLEAREVRIEFSLGVHPFNGDQTKVRGGEAEVSQGSPIQLTNVDGICVLFFGFHKKITPERKC